ncbi:MAG: nucleoside deaminase [Anaerolineae bacterium]|nr:nucleoside deaminase [Anaerolineae bacterium]
MVSEADRQFMAEALREALLAPPHGDVPVGAVVVLDGQVIGRGHNEKECRPDPTAHAEILALRQAAGRLGTWRLSGATLYCTMEPCLMCAGAMLQARLGRLVYAVDDPKAGAAGSLLDVLRAPFLNHRVEVVRGVLAAEVAAVLKEFFSGLRSATSEE